MFASVSVCWYIMLLIYQYIDNSCKWYISCAQVTYGSPYTQTPSPGANVQLLKPRRKTVPEENLAMLTWGNINKIWGYRIHFDISATEAGCPTMPWNVWPPETSLSTRRATLDWAGTNRISQLCKCIIGNNEIYLENITVWRYLSISNDPNHEHGLFFDISLGISSRAGSPLIQRLLRSCYPHLSSL